MGNKNEVERNREKDSTNEDSKKPSEKLLQESRQETPAKNENDAAQKFVDKNLPSADSLLKPCEQLEGLEYDNEGKVAKFTDRNGDVIERRGDKWYRTNLITPEGEELASVKPGKDGDSIEITYKVPKGENANSQEFYVVTKTVYANGKEVAVYPEGTSTETTRNGNEKNVVVKNKEGQVTQTLKYNGMELTELNASDGTRYVRNADGNGWTKFKADGEQDTSFATNDKFAVKADADGNAAVRNANLEKAKLEDGGAFYATRFYPDGTRAYSSATNEGRVYVDREGNKLDRPEPLSKVFVQEMPENWKELLEQRRAESRKFPYTPTDHVSTLAFLYSKTADKGDWDDKQNGGQYQAWGNVAWGVYAAETGLPYEDAIWWNGVAKTYVNRKSENQNWGRPSDWWFSSEKSTYGQNPADAELIKRGYAYQAKLEEDEPSAYAQVQRRLKQLRLFVDSTKLITFGQPLMPV